MTLKNVFLFFLLITNNFDYPNLMCILFLVSTNNWK